MVLHREALHHVSHRNVETERVRALTVASLTASLRFDTRQDLDVTEFQTYLQFFLRSLVLYCYAPTDSAEEPAVRNGPSPKSP